MLRQLPFKILLSLRTHLYQENGDPSRLWNPAPIQELGTFHMLLVNYLYGNNISQVLENILLF